MPKRWLRDTSGEVCSVGPHLIGCLTRAAVLGGRAARRCRELLEQIVANDAMADHELVVRIGPDSPLALLRVLCGTAPVLRQEPPHLRNHATVWWSLSYMAASVGELGSLVIRYVEFRRDAVAL